MHWQNNKTVKEAGNNNGVGFLTLASNQLSDTLSVDSISVGVLTTALENVAFLRAQNGGTGSRLNFSYEALSQQRTNMRAALGRMVDVDVAEESTNLSKYNVLFAGSSIDDCTSKLDQRTSLNST